MQLTRGAVIPAESNMQYFDDLNTDGNLYDVVTEQQPNTAAADVTLTDAFELNRQLNCEQEGEAVVFNVDSEMLRSPAQQEIKHANSQPIVLTNWTIRPLAKGGVCVEGLKKFVFLLLLSLFFFMKGVCKAGLTVCCFFRHSTDPWHSSKIRSRNGIREVVTKSGKIYQLQGHIDEGGARSHGLLILRGLR